MKLLKHIFCLFLVVFIYSCASIKPPPGGALDETPPEIVFVTPANGTSNLISDKIIIKFSEYMDESSFNNNYKIYPQVKTPLGFKFKGDEIILTLPDSLDSEKTYIIYLNRSIKDEHGVALAETIQLAYSTGDKISNGVIAGRVYSSEPASVHLWHINGSITDSVFARTPDYLTDVSDNGFYSFGYLSPGNYQVLSVDKSSAGLPLITERTGYGLPWRTILNLTENDTLSYINMKLWKEPQKLKLLRGEWPELNWGRLIFNNDLPEDLTIDITLKLENGETLDSLLYYRDQMDIKNLIVQVSDTLLSKYISVNIESIKVNNELLLDSTEVSIQIPEEPDTSYLQILKPIPNFQISPNNILGDELDIIFSKPVQISEDSLLLPKLFKNDSVLVGTNIVQKNPMQIELIPVLGWEENIKYQLKFYQEGILANNGRGFKDSVFTINLMTNKKIGYGAVSGKINDSLQANISIELFSVKNPSLSQVSIVNSKSEFEFKTVQEGDYSLFIFKDSDNDMNYSFGKAYPIKPSEWFYFYPDTFEVRANWETEITPINLEKVF